MIELRFLGEQASVQVTTQERKRDGKDSNVDEALFQYFSLASSRGIQVSDLALKAKSEDLIKLRIITLINTYIYFFLLTKYLKTNLSEFLGFF